MAMDLAAEQMTGGQANRPSRAKSGSDAGRTDSTTDGGHEGGVTGGPSLYWMLPGSPSCDRPSCYLHSPKQSRLNRWAFSPSPSHPSSAFRRTVLTSFYVKLGGG